MVAGVGAGRRVLVASAVARDWSDDEVAVVVAHELAHHVHHDLLQALALNAAVLCAGLWAGDIVVRLSETWLGLRGPSDLAALPIVAFVASMLWLATTPLRHAQSRAQERRADRFALAATGNADAFASAVRRASARHMAEERPTLMTRWLFHRHPSVSERLELADAWRGGRGGTGTRG
jgi:STE24 endopeptidase